MIRAATVASPEYIADFAAGDGALLAGAGHRWPNSQVIGIDVNNRNVISLKKNQRWHVARCDFLASRSRLQCQLLSEIAGKVSIILLNPPFSCRGGSYLSVKFDGEMVSCSRALAFVLIALGYLRSGGQLIAVLPAGSIVCEKDQHGWELVRRVARCDIVAEYPRGEFARCTARTVLVRMILGQMGTPVQETTARRAKISNITVQIMRGSVQMYTVNGTDSGEAFHLIHTTELGTMNHFGGPRVRNRGRVLKGPAVLLPRVGNPDVEKVTLYVSGKPVLLSDCVVALRCRTRDEAKTVYGIVRKRWNILEKAYGGTCARYITLRALAEVLRSMGIEADKLQAKKVATGEKGVGIGI